jgi:hypothetical protein
LSRLEIPDEIIHRLTMKRLIAAFSCCIDTRAFSGGE